MQPLDLHITDPVEALVVEQALALARPLKQVCRDAPDGQLLARAEQAAVERGRPLTRAAREAALNEQAVDVEKKGLPSGVAPGGTAASTQAARSARS
jgi:hypothetical protein